MKTKFLAFAVVVSSLLFTVTAFGARTITVGFYPAPGMMTGAKDGSVKSGYAYDYLQELASYGGWRFQYVYGSFGELYQKLRTGEIDMLPYVTKTEKREAEVLFPKMKMGDERIYLGSLKTEKLGKNLAEVRGRKVGLIKGAFYNDIARAANAGCTFIEYDLVSEMDDALEKGDIDLIAALSTAYQKLDLHAVYEFDVRYPFYLAVAKNQQELLKEVDAVQDYIENTQPGFTDALRQKYFKGTPLYRDLSAEGRRWFQEHRSLRIGAYNYDAPYVIDHGNGRASGIAPEYVELMLKSLKVEIPVEWRIYDGRESALSALRSGEIDIINPYNHNYGDAENDGVVISRPTFGVNFGVLYEGDFTRDTMSVIATPHTRLGARYVRDNYPDAKIVPCQDGYDCIRRYLAGDAKCVVMHIDALEKIAAEYRRDFRIKPLNTRCEISFAALSSNAALIGAIDKAIPFLTDVELNVILNKYNVEKDLDLTIAQFLKRHPEYIYLALVFILLLALVAATVRARWERRKREHQLELAEFARVKEEQRKVDMLHEIVHSGKWSFFVDAKDEITGTEYSDAVQRVIGNDLPNGDGYAWAKIVHPEDREAAVAAFKATIADRTCRTPYDVTYRMQDRNGVYHWFHSAGRVFRQPDGSGEFFGTHIDITEQIEKRLRQQGELAEALKRAENANRAKTQFLFNMSHDIRTPMNAIKGFTEMAIMKNRDPAVLECLNKIQSSGELMLMLINGVLDMSRVESGEVEMREQEGDVTKSFADVESTVAEFAKAKGIELAFEFRNIDNRYVYADFEKTSRVFMNIISNGIKYSRPGGWVRVTCEQVGGNGGEVAIYRYTFADNGIGMSKEFQKHVFDLFARERNSTTSGIEGAGLGLALTKSFVELLGGTIRCSSKQGEGTTFVVELPFRVREADANEELRMKNEEWRNDRVASEEGDHHHSSFKGRRVLLVEDNDLNREVAEFLLKERGFEVDIAENGREAVEKAADVDYDLILMDIQMPVMNGYEATRAIRANEELRMKNEKCDRSSPSHIPIIAVSANAFAEDRAASLAAGMDDHVAKPIKMKELMEAIQRVKAGVKK